MCGTGRPSRSAKRRTRPGKQAETRDVAFLGRFEQQLHADADAEQRLPQLRIVSTSPALSSRAMQSAAAPTPGRITCVAARTRRASVVRSDVDAEPLDREAQGRDVGTAAVDDRQPHHNVPFVLGSSVSVTRIAWRSARPTPLKQASIMWCVFSPLTLILIAAPSVRRANGRSAARARSATGRPGHGRSGPSNTK